MDKLFRLIAMTLALVPQPALAQGLQAILQQANEGDAELKQIDAALNDPDPDRRISALNAIAGSGVDRYVRKALDVALVSDDPRLREAALQAAVVDGANFRIEVDLTAKGDDVTDAAGWLRQNGGSISVDGNTGYIMVPLEKYNDKYGCWVHLHWNSCAMSIAGEQVFFSSRSNAEGQMLLDESGNLVGSVLVNGTGNPVPIVLHLMD